MKVLPFRDRKLSDVPVADLEEFKDARFRKGLSISTVRLDLILIKVVYEKARKWRDCQGLVSPFADFDMPTVNRAAQKVRLLRPGEEARVLKATQRYGDEGRKATPRTRAELYAMVVLALDTGKREGELLETDWGNIDPEARTIFVPKEISKNDEDRIVPLTRRAAEALRARSPEVDPQTLNFKRIRPGVRLKPLGKPVA